MADFEGLIKQALARQNADDPAVRERIYQSSRNALVKMLAQKGISTEEGVRPHYERLQESIGRIEAEYASTQPVQAAEFVPAPSPSPESEPAQAPEPDLTPEPIAGEPPEPQMGAAEPVQQPTVPGEPPAIMPSATETVSSGPAVDTDIVSVETGAPDAPQPPQKPAEPEPFVPDAPVVPDSVPSVNSLPEQAVRESGGQVTEPSADMPPAHDSAMTVQDPAISEPPVPDRPQTGSAIEPEKEHDIIAELEALMPKAYEPAPLFPAPESAGGSSSSSNIEHVAPEPVHEPGFARDAQFPDDQVAPEPPQAQIEPYLGDVTGEAEPPQAGIDEFVAERDAPPVYKRKNPLLRRIWPIALALAVILVILWILYALLANMPASEPGNGGDVQPGAVGEVQQGEDGSIYITLLEPTDLSALITAGRGTAELVPRNNRQVLRLQSVRQGELTDSGADPVLLELEKGVLRQISGKEVTVEIYAQSGESGAAQFAVECDFAGDSICGRKRFRVGAQPERIVFALDLKDGISADARAYLTISTDITSAADASGEGDAVDIIYVRLRLHDDNS